jgi:hypothetical protein
MLAYLIRKKDASMVSEYHGSYIASPKNNITHKEY